MPREQNVAIDCEEKILFLRFSFYDEKYCCHEQLLHRYVLLLLVSFMDHKKVQKYMMKT